MRILSWPFVAAGALIALIFSAVGRVFTFGLGMALIALGVMLCISLVGLVVGVPLTAFGGALVVRAFF